VQGLTLPIERSVAAGFAADRLGYAFAAGYTEALHQLLPTLGDTRAALCATEAGGAHPRAIQTRLTAAADGTLRLDGDKTFVTLGNQAATLLIVASAGQDEQGRNRLALCQIPVDRLGATLELLPPTPFAPEIPHAILHLRAVVVAAHERLPGDAYERYLKPFRTVEDLHVQAAVLGWLLQVARRAHWPRALQQELLLLISATRSLGTAAPDDPAIHVALGGLLAGTRRLREEIGSHWQLVEPTTRALWERDRPLLDIAGKARAQRLEVAWERLASTG
jgi:alkylation response protein AidB-like acyl-CoA dehydrogenase